MKQLSFLLCVTLLLGGCQSNTKGDEEIAPPKLEQEEVEVNDVDFTTVPLTLIGSHRVYPIATDVKLLFSNLPTMQVIGDTSFRALTYIPEHEAMYYVANPTLMNSTATKTTAIGGVNLDDYSIIEYGLENKAVLYSTTNFDDSSNESFNLFIQTEKVPFLQVAARVKHFDLSDNGKHLYYINEKGEVIDYEVETQIETIIATNYEQLYYVKELDALLLQNTFQAVDLYYKNELTSLAQQMPLMNAAAVKVDEDHLYFLDYQMNEPINALSALLAEENQLIEATGELYRYSLSTQTTEQISNKSISHFGVHHDETYFLTTDGQLYIAKNQNSSQLIADQVVSVAMNDEAVYYVTSNAYLYQIQDGHSTNLSTHIDLDALHLLEQSIENNELIYLSDAGTLTYNGDEFNERCESAAYENGLLAAYTLADKVYYINPRTNENLLLLDDTSAYDEIYFGNDLLKYREFQYDDEPVTIDPVIVLETTDSNAENLLALAESKFFSPSFMDIHFYDSTSFIMPHSLDSYLNATELFNYYPDELALIRNEIFARNGYLFDSEFYQAYFKSKNWYVEQSKNVSINEIAQMNVDLIQSLENGGLSIPDDSLGSLSANEAYHILLQAYPDYVPIRYDGISDLAFHWTRQQDELAFGFLFQSTLFEADNFYYGFVFSDGTYQFKHAPLMD